ncbi:hypothetical protein KDA11_06815, partial [Candidatus Saccharibacteria bacterium]|nr:hypothetical protein [Candidatus Saccharibacteria bacterium]
MKAYDTQHWARTSTYPGTLSGPLTASAWIRSELGGELQFQLRLRGTLVNSNTLVTYDSTTFRFTSAEYVQKSFTVTPPEPIKNVQVELRFIAIGFNIQYPSFGGFQLEKGTYATSMIHGYYGEGYSWLGIPFDSPSKRTVDAVCGGRLVNLRDLGFRLTAVNGLGIPEDFDLNAQSRANGRGSVFTCRSIESREISFDGMLYACSLETLLSKRNQLGYAVFSYDSPRCFVWQPLDECDNPLPCVEFTGVLDKGMSFNFATHYGEEIELTFTNFDIEITECGTSCTDLVFKDRVLANGLVTLDVNGNFVVVPPPPGFQVLKRAEISRYNGKLYIAYNVGGNTRIAEYDGSDWTVIAQATGSNTALYSYGKYLFAAVNNLGVYTASGPYTGNSVNYFAIIDLQEKTIVGNPG